MHARLQTITKSSVKFRNNRHKTIREVEHTRYLLFKGTESTEGRNAEKYVPSLFFEWRKNKQTKKKQKKNDAYRHIILSCYQVKHLPECYIAF